MDTNGAVDVAVVGAGAAGLACALDLAAAGRRVRLLEASDGVGGRMRTDLRDGFRLDRGFQVFNTSYPQVRRRLDLRPLRLRPFTPGFLLAGPAGHRRVADPLRRPDLAGDLLTGRTVPPRDAAALAALTVRDALLPAALLRHGRDVPAAVALRAAGVSRTTVDGVLRPFLSGVFLEDGLATSSRVLHLYWRSLVRGTLALPAAGIGAVPRALATLLPPGTLELDARAAEVHRDGVVLADGREVAARCVVVATEAAAAAALLPGLPVPETRSVTTFYHVAERSPLAEPTLLVDAAGRLLNSVVLSEVVPGCAPRGLSLVSTSVLGTTAEEGPVRARLAELYSCDTSDWHPLAAYRIPGALPAMPAPHPLTRTARWAPGRYVCGDHRATGSVQGALASGARAAREVLADLATGPDRRGPGR
ncbi:flavin-dependent amine oxidoreductase [Kitasatospora sp. SolWspMP-SS2h]|uniref:FAD-dependent oxidoreductase n=1 Tax=Kitasatospora sp. SolWspMP-SS2h TaxID=1305729 RepID=UPI000DBFF867|nr:FAD-dependent oxidoreductase [Kitasatospora sp. SolWspMP-SS2h]RAJ45472.1 flavin-dependent amine oxidoreductase [Kitasatospora sp. SolWspMP-SS2h]